MGHADRGSRSASSTGVATNTRRCCCECQSVDLIRTGLEASLRSGVEGGAGGEYVIDEPDSIEARSGALNPKGPAQIGPAFGVAKARLGCRITYPYEGIGCQGEIEGLRDSARDEITVIEAAHRFERSGVGLRMGAIATRGPVGNEPFHWRNGARSIAHFGYGSIPTGFH